MAAPTEVEHFQLDLSFEPGVDCWRRDVDAHTESGEAALALDPGGQSRIDRN